MKLKVATWNVNSLRVRLAQLLEWLASNQPDIIALQEIKLEAKDFPIAELQAAGYQFVMSGQKTYNGVAILSRLPIQNAQMDIDNYADPQRRVLLATIADVRIINLYVPNGAAVGTDKYSYKLEWLTKITEEIIAQQKLHKKIVILGDFNIAPEDRDVHDPKVWEGQVLVSEKERTALKKLFALDFHDSFRLFEQETGFYSWWDYRAGAFRRNHGLRIDHILISDPLRNDCKNCYIEKTARAVERPSDHVPVVAEFEF